jgi:hypothetical protein
VMLVIIGSSDRGARGFRESSEWPVPWIENT